MMGGVDNFPVDRELGDYLARTAGDGVDAAHASTRAVAAFAVRTVEHLVAECGIRQFLSIGVPIPGEDVLHEVAQKAAPECRVVYVGADPLILAHAHRLEKGAPDGATAYIHHDLRDPDSLLLAANATLDLGLPVAVTLIETLNYVRDEDRPHAIAARLMQVMPPGSYLVLSHTTSDIHGEAIAKVAAQVERRTGTPFVPRSRATILRFFDGLELVGPGFVQIDQWRVGREPPAPCSERLVPIFGAVARKP